MRVDFLLPPSSVAGGDFDELRSAVPRADRSRSSRPGDRVFFEPGENHRQGATPDRFMAHIARQQNNESGSPVSWGEHVTDEEYNAAQ
jgi:hypothetical protein